MSLGEQQDMIGNLYGRVQDTSGEDLPGVILTLTGVGTDRNQVSDAQGKFRFIGLSPGTYELEAQLEGFTPFAQVGIKIHAGKDTNIDVTMQPAAVE